MKLSDTITRKRTTEEYQMIRESKYIEKLESLAVPMPEALIKISKMMKTFDYSETHAICISQYIFNYMKVTKIVDCPLKNMMAEFREHFSNTLIDPVTEGVAFLVINENGIKGGIYVNNKR